LIQGTASVVSAGIIAAPKLVGGTLADHTFLFLGAGESEAQIPFAFGVFSFFILFVCLFFLHAQIKDNLKVIIHFFYTSIHLL
jgi:hypothetical protein